MAKFEILVFVLFLIESLKSAAVSNEDYPGLYGLNDNIEILNVKNFNTKLYNQKNAWLIEFYSSWCGHCQKFAPHFKEFAAEVRPWSRVVKVGAIDCAQNENTPVCRQFEIMGYPTVKYFHEMFPEDTNKFGLPMKTSDNKQFLLSHFLEILTNEQIENRLTSAPNLIPYNGTTIIGLFNKPNDFVYTIVEPADSILGSQLILDLWYMNDIIIRRILSTSPMITTLNVEKVPSLIAVHKDLNIVPLTPSQKNRDNLKNAVKLYYGSLGFELPGDPLPEPFNQGLVIGKNISEFDDMIDKIIKAGDVLYRADLEHGLGQMLKQEISRAKTINETLAEPAINFLTVLIKYFPFGREGKEILTELKQLIVKTPNLPGGVFMEKVKDLDQIYMNPLQWIGCRSSSMKYKRRESCATWKLFHYLTVQATKSDRLFKNEVLIAMHGYIKNFFGCQECSQHFQKMAAEKKIFNVHTADDAVLWLWEAHNIVNARLAGDAYEDPMFPKIQFPSTSHCPQCRNIDGEWNRPEVLRYLKSVYDTVRDTLPDESISSTVKVSSSVKLSSYDVSFYLLLYILSAGILVIIIRLFLRKGYRKKAYVHDLLGKQQHQPLQHEITTESFMVKV